MKDLFFMGGPLGMSLLTILLVTMMAWMSFHLIKFLNSEQDNVEIGLRMLKYGKSIGLFALIVGIFFQLIGFYQAFSAIEQVGDVSPAMVFGGIKVSMISTIYGIIIFLLSVVYWFVASQIIENKKFQGV